MQALNITLVMTESEPWAQRAGFFHPDVMRRMTKAKMRKPSKFEVITAWFQHHLLKLFVDLFCLNRAGRKPLRVPPAARTTYFAQEIFSSLICEPEAFSSLTLILHFRSNVLNLCAIKASHTWVYHHFLSGCKPINLSHLRLRWCWTEKAVEGADNTNLLYLD